jgi:hypothetical protein
MDLVVDPPRAVGPLSIGMPIMDAEQLLYAIDGAIPSSRGSRRNPGFVHFESGMSIQVQPDSHGRLRAVEIYSPSRDVRVMYGQISIFETPVDELIAILSAQTPLEIEYEGLRATAPELLISLARDMAEADGDGIEGRYFESMLVARPGYYDEYERAVWSSGGVEESIAPAVSPSGDGVQDALF